MTDRSMSECRPRVSSSLLGGEDREGNVVGASSGAAVADGAKWSSETGTAVSWVSDSTRKTGGGEPSA